MSVIDVKDMHCEKCVERITGLLTEEGLGFEVDLKERTVTVDGDFKEVNTAIEALEDLGFSPKLRF
ncbi:heavy metal-associated domain-containing protein [Suipraeoptans intestinalis]|uniref:heavy-metal-associated domain-containing protein n=1 Tax=Suipraeoptans intestinalis TaxID=2606628 RepID=UPI002A75B0FA|nr:heavy metal-associated domain-containing protein [Suipraeoptans intestinalis]MDY3121528.1 heavy metal-associated domain-containing protein [Suipraeoptans intestinalis]